MSVEEWKSAAAQESDHELLLPLMASHEQTTSQQEDISMETMIRDPFGPPIEHAAQAGSILWLKSYHEIPESIRGMTTAPAGAYNHPILLLSSPDTVSDFVEVLIVCD